MRQLQDLAENYKLNGSVLAPLGMEPNKFLFAMFDLSDVMQKLEEKRLLFHDVRIPSTLADAANLTKATASERPISTIGSPHSPTTATTTTTSHSHNAPNGHVSFLFRFFFIFGSQFSIRKSIQIIHLFMFGFGFLLCVCEYENSHIRHEQ
jgi:hypothetical protein